MASKVQQLEARVDELEREMSVLRAQLDGKERVPWYRQVAGAFAGDSVYAEITRLGQKIRKAERRKAR
jgi:phage shock protein A